MYAASALGGKMPQGERRVMDCIDCHNRAAHTMQTAEDALNRAMAEGAVSPELPFVHKKGLELLKADYATEAEARQKIPAQLEAFYRSEHPEVMAAKANLVKASGDGLVQIFTHNVFPEMKVTWGTHPNHIGHMSYPGASAATTAITRRKNGTAITQDCAACHNLLAVDEKKPKVLTDLGITTPLRRRSRKRGQQGPGTEGTACLPLSSLVPIFAGSLLLRFAPDSKLRRRLSRRDTIGPNKPARFALSPKVVGCEGVSRTQD